VKVRILVIFALFAAGATAAAVLVLSSPEVMSFSLEDGEPPEAAVDPSSPNPLFAHVKGYLASIADTKNLLTAARGAPVPNAPGISMRHFRGDRVVAGTIELRWNEQTVGLFQNWLELVPIDGSRVVLHRAWHGPDIAIIAVSLRHLRPLPTQGLTDRASAIGGGEELFAFDEGAYAEAQIPRDLAPGEHAFCFSEGLREIDELLLLYPSTRDDASNRTHVMRIEPRQGKITVVAPKSGAFRRLDEARAPVRLFRDPRTRRVVGDGMKVRPFVLTEGLTGIDAWLD
jgi:hypothetical protein